MATLKTPVTTADHRAGVDDAPVTLVEYGDYECPHCGHAYPIVQRIQEHFGDQLRFVFRNFPLNESHPHAEAAAEVAEFSAAHGKFWEMHDLLFENQSQLRGEIFEELASSLGLSADAMVEEVNNGKYRSHVRKDFEGGVRSGVNGTPTFFINGKRHDASFEFEQLVAAIDQALSTKR
jgi:protein-disulfide isomerase